METVSVFLEINCEEIPARMQKEAAEKLEKKFWDALLHEGFGPSHPTHTAISPRHMAVEVSGVLMQQPDTIKKTRGPRVGAPDKAIDGFCASAGIGREKLEQEDTAKGMFYFAHVPQKGVALSDRLPTIIQDILSKFFWPKSQRWGHSQMRWVRPLHRVNLLIDGKLCRGALDLGGDMSISFGSETEGHPFHTDEPVSLNGLKDFDDYRERMKAAHVLMDADERKRVIKTQVEAKAAALGLTWREDEGLLDEVTGLVEWPNVLIGKIDNRFMGLPPEVMVTSMRVHQKFFALNDGSGKMAPYFLTVANRESDAGGDALIIAGNERVLRARLSDAAFFYGADQQRRLVGCLPELSKVVFYEGLGSVGDKCARLQKLILEVAKHIPGCDQKVCVHAAALCKADLVTYMVGEFPELQGIMGGYYAKSGDETDRVAAAIYDHYCPVGPADRLPVTPEGLALSLADKIDTLVGFFGVGAKPTGSKDPYALRRAALAILRIMDEEELNLPLDKLFETAASLYPNVEVDEELASFMTDRLVTWLRIAGLPHDIAAATIKGGDISQLNQQINKAWALDKVLKSEAGDALIAGYRRAVNILAAEEAKVLAEEDIPWLSIVASPSLLIEPEERHLFAALQALHEQTDTSKEGLANMMKALADLRGPIDAFFEAVRVNADDPELRMNRRSLLLMVRWVMELVADFSKIEKR